MEIKKLLNQRIEIVNNDLDGTDEDIIIHGEIEEYKKGFKDALEWVLSEID